MDEDDQENLLKALDDEDNSFLLNTNSEKIENIKISVLSELFEEDHETIANIMEKIQHFIYVDGIPELKYGSFIRWISLKNPENMKLTNGAIICDIKITQHGTSVLCKGINGRIFSIKMDDTYIFRKLTQQEQIILNVIDHLNK